MNEGGTIERGRFRSPGYVDVKHVNRIWRTPDAGGCPDDREPPGSRPGTSDVRGCCFRSRAGGSTCNTEYDVVAHE
ncbi:hypothetical protein [Yersinia intermedia]|uniref:hypothetical protein n=1 Tax=Yersinia intermedia TaxID=631 RepID=UPI00163FCF7F|nr:hypothetical protein [Yersinia intermedia]MCB5315722.1 hypothetical protein [Yersinia intermedia]MCB5329773.1 hypothetical protein [Yersinia intermedia]